MAWNIGWSVDAEGRGCVERVDHGLCQDVMRTRVNEGGLWRLMGQWRHAGVREGAQVTDPEQGTPQGGVLAPLLATMCLHAVLDAGDERDVTPRMHG